MTKEVNSADRILRWPEVHQKTGLCRSYVHLLISRGEFPHQIILGKRCSGWLESDITAWINEKVSNSGTRHVRS